MRKIEILLLFMPLLFASLCFGQTVSGTVIYKIKLVDYGVDSKDPEFKELNEETVKIANLQTCTLSFNNFQSSSVLDRYLIANDQNSGLKKMARTMAFIVTNGNDYFFDKSTNKAIKRDDNGNLIKINHEKLDWEVTTDTKYIDGYLCYKAIYQMKFINRRGVNMSIPIIAWFAPSLPYSYGPKYFNGLPGLILELIDRETMFYASSVKVVNDEVLIDFPKGKIISEEQYSKKVLSN
jgi:GLPGLI family protein